MSNALRSRRGSEDVRLSGKKRAHNSAMAVLRLSQQRDGNTTSQLRGAAGTWRRRWSQRHGASASASATAQDDRTSDTDQSTHIISPTRLTCAGSTEPALGQAALPCLGPLKSTAGPFRGVEGERASCALMASCASPLCPRSLPGPPKALNVNRAAAKGRLGSRARPRALRCGACWALTFASVANVEGSH